MPKARQRRDASGKVIVLGGVNVDILLSLDRLPCAGETIEARGVSRQLGGKGANQAVGAAQAGANSVLLAAVGDDADGAAMIAALADYGVDVGLVRRVAMPTGCAVVATSCEDNQIIVVAGANSQVDATLAALVCPSATDVCLAQLETPVAATVALFERARAEGATTILNAAPAALAACEILPVTDILVVNELEFRLLADLQFDRPLDDERLVAARAQIGVADAAMIVTLGGGGVVISHGGKVTRIAGHRVPVVDTAGAGDCFCGYLAAAIARGENLEVAVIEANAAASIAVQSLGTASAIPPRSATLRVLAAAQI